VKEGRKKREEDRRGGRKKEGRQVAWQEATL
jgi:hypothetical protein